MKKRIYIITIFLAGFFLFSCNEEAWLEEQPLDFYTPSNSFTTASNFKQAVTHLYKTSGDLVYSDSPGGSSRKWENWAFFYPSDELRWFNPDEHMNNYDANMNPDNYEVQYLWRILYEIISQSNVILGRIDNPDIVFTTEEERDILKAEAMFFRAFAYRILGIAWGGVPLVTTEFTAPKRDFVRNSREEIWAQCISDLEFAVSMLPTLEDIEADGQLTKAAANHLLSEMYIITEDWDKAISAASAVIDDPNYNLMDTRFGTKMDEPGNVYLDLFHRDNQNRNSRGGLNTEAIWVKQFEYNVTGGGNSVKGPRFFTPLYWQLKGITDDKNLFIGPCQQYGGRGIGWLVSNDYLRNQIWQSDFDNDMRNSEYCIIRDIIANNPESAYFGQGIVESDAFNPETQNRNERWWSVIFAKYGMINDVPDEYVLDAETGLISGDAEDIYTDNYIYRLAETYLLRAEAYLGKGDLQAAVNDINLVRSRSNALPANPSDINIEYILDERARELYLEETRVLTLMRLGTFVERNRMYNTLNSDNISDRHNLWPIPQSEIERNTEAVLEQNPGY